MALNDRPMDGMPLETKHINFQQFFTLIGSHCCLVGRALLVIPFYTQLAYLLLKIWKQQKMCLAHFEMLTFNYFSANLSSKESGKLEETESQVRAKRTRHMMFLAVAYAANCGGTGTLTGTGSNLVLKGALSEINNNPINFATW